MSIKDITGLTFGRLKVVKLAEIDKMGEAKWLCECVCGNQKIVTGNKLRSGNTLSCGCLREEVRGTYNRTHGMSASGKKKNRLYNIWLNMKRRCTNKNNPEFYLYGGRGISICKEWLDFSVFADWAFSHGYQDDLSIDRIDVNGPYTPENCRWITNKSQQNNKRNNHILTVNGETHTIAEWSEISGIKYDTIERRINKYGWTEKEAVTIPPNGRR